LAQVEQFSKGGGHVNDGVRIRGSRLT